MSYPQLSDEQQKNLPALTVPATPIAAKFEDSTHQLWLCETDDGPMVLKVCNRQSIHDSSFWKVMNSLFAINFPNSLGDIAAIHQFLANYGSVAVPDYVASESSSFVLSRLLQGEDVEAEQVTDDMVMQLARHLGQLHQQTHQTWGEFHQPQFAAEAWAERLQQTLTSLIAPSSVALSKAQVTSILDRAAAIDVEQFVPIMADLRWDQFLHQQGQLFAVVDLDAFVIGPREFELTILEYQLSPEQGQLFKTVYEEYLPFPDLDAVRDVYRLMFFLMNALGERNVSAWMQYPAHF